MEKSQDVFPEKGMHPQELLRIIRSAWDERTTDDWHPDDPARHHCGVTALVVQDLLGGDVVRNVIGDRTVYFNMLPEGQAIFHREEYDGQARSFPTDQELTRDKMMANPDMPRRYALLSARVLVAIATQGDPLDLENRNWATQAWSRIAFDPKVGDSDRHGLLEEIRVWAQSPFDYGDYFRERTGMQPE